MKHRPTRRKHYLDPATWQLLKQLGLGALVLTVVASLLIGTWYLTRLEAVTISKLAVKPGETIKVETIEALVNDALAGTYFQLVPRRFYWWYPQAEIVQAIESVERVRSVEVGRTDTNTLRVEFTEYLPDALWCFKEAERGCLFLDPTGLAFTPAPALAGGSLVRYYTLQSEPERGQSVANQDDYTKTKEFIARLAETGWFVTQVEIDTVRDAFYTLAGGGEIKVTLTEDPLRALTYLQTIRQSDKFAHLKPGNFQYIDIRFGTKLFVNEELVTATSTSTSTENVEESSVVVDSIDLSAESMEILPVIEEGPQ